MRYLFEFLAFKILYIIFYPFPRKIHLITGKFLGTIIFFLLKSKRKIALNNLRLAFGKEKSESEIKTIAKRCFQHLGSTIFDLIWFMKKGEECVKKTCKINGMENLQKARELGKGVLLLSAHFGNWEIILHILTIEGFPLTAIARKLDNPYLNATITKFREKYGGRIILKQEAKKEATKMLKNGGLVLILADQNTLKTRGIFVDFFGTPACTSTGLALFHLKYGSPIIPIFCYPGENHNYIVEIMNPIETSPEDSLLKITQTYTKIIEDKIRKNPHLWLWVHQRWKEKPQEGGKNEVI